MSLDAENRFSFESIENESETTKPPALQTLPADLTVQALDIAKQVSYHWDISSDHITWSPNTKASLGFYPNHIASGRQFSNLMDHNNYFSRYDTILRSSDRDTGEGVAYEIEYRMKQDANLGTSATWIEDCGRWFAGPNGNPSHAIGMMRIADARHKRDQQMDFLSNCDPLTGMMNRARMGDALGEAIEVAINDKVPCAFAIIAVNNLDVMNEAYGFEVADEVIVALGQRLRQVMRMGDGIARYSGSKFAIILNNCKSDELTAALERFMRAVRDSVIETKLGPVWALLSIGAVNLPAMGENPSTAIAHAEEALSEAFRLPGDGFVVFNSSEERTARRMLNARCATEIVSCLRDGLFKLAFQPVFNATTGEVIMHEALLRMVDTTGALITAGHLVPIAERLGLIRLIDRAVLQLSLQTLQTYPDARLSINISATTVTDPRWNTQLLEMIAAASEPASRLIVEITETAALENLTTSREFVLSLRELGCGVALDDFGAGYTSYRNLKGLKLSHIKLDGSFCCNLTAGSENHTFVRSMVELAHAFDLKVVAEWVDTAADAEILANLGVDYLQGNMLGEASIIAPWMGKQESTFQMEVPGLAPVDRSHFEHLAPDIATPHSDGGEAHEHAGEGVFADVVEVDDDGLSANITAVEVEALNDEALAAEIAELNQSLDDSQDMQDLEYLVTMEPLYETALAQAPNPSPDEISEVAASAPLEVEQVDDADRFEDNIDDNLFQLRAALAELNTAFGTADRDTERLAS